MKRLSPNALVSSALLLGTCLLLGSPLMATDGPVFPTAASAPFTSTDPAPEPEIDQVVDEESGPLLAAETDDPEPVPAPGEQPLPEAFNGPMGEEILFHEALSDYGMRRLKPAREKLDLFIKRAPKSRYNSRARFELARINIDDRNYDAGIEILTALAETTPVDYQIRMARELLIKTLTELQRFKVAIDLLEKWWKANNNDLPLGRQLAACYMQAGRADEGRFLLESLLERTADREVFNDLLKIATRSGGLESLLNSIESRRVRFRTADYLEFSTSCLLALKRDEQAAKTLREAPETKDTPLLLQRLAKLDLDAGRFDLALASYQRLSQLGGSDWENIKAIGHCLFLLKRTPEAIAVWKKPVQTMGFAPMETWSQFTDVLIEHKLYEEALQAFAEARKALGNPGQFAEERAGVLQVLGRKDEALEEYLTALALGMFKPDIFDKLYESRSASFDLTARLQRRLTEMPGALSLQKALLEVWFRSADPARIPEILGIGTPGSQFDDILAERIAQALAGFPSPFVRELMIAAIARQRASTLSFKLALQLLDWPDPSAAEIGQTRREAEQTAAIDPPPDAVLKATLQNKLARFLFERQHDLAAARVLCQSVLSLPQGLPITEARLESNLLMMRLATIAGDFPTAERCLADARPLIATGSEDAARALVEEAWLLTHKADLQNALLKLKDLTEQHPDSLWLNDGLELALFLTMNSIGSLEPVTKFLAAERLAAAGSLTAALSELEQLETVASSTPLGLEAKARRLLLSESVATAATLLPLVDAFVGFHPNHHAVPDLLLLKWHLLKQQGAGRDAISDLLKDFLDRFPGDLRARRISLAMEELMKAPSAK